MSASHPLSGRVTWMELSCWRLLVLSKMKLLYGCFQILKSSVAAFFYARGRISKELFEIVCSLKFVAKFSKKEKKFTNLVGDGMS